MKFRVKSFCRSLLVVVGIGVVQVSWAGRSNYQELYVFGDSLSDAGNPNASYWQGRYANGPFAAEYLWDLMSRKNGSELTPSLVLDSRVKKSGVSFAFGGSTSGGMA